MMARWKKISPTLQVYQSLRCPIEVERLRNGMISWAFMGDTHREHGLADTVAGAKADALRACREQGGR